MFTCQALPGDGNLEDIQTYMFRASVNDQIEVLLFTRTQCLAHSTRLVRIAGYVNSSAIWTKQMSYSPSGPMQMKVVMVFRHGTGRRLSAIDQCCWRRAHYGDKGTLATFVRET